MIDWYESERVEDVIDGAGDMLLFQWGTYDWGSGPSFEFDLKRQFIVADEPDDDVAIWQLHLTLHFAPDARLGWDTQWCGGPGEAPMFREMMTAKRVMTFVQQLAPDRTEIRLERAG